MGRDHERRTDGYSEDSNCSGWQRFTYINDSSTIWGDPKKAASRVQHLGESCVTMTALSLDSTQTGDRIRVVSLGCGDANNRLMGMGLMPGVELVVVSKTVSGSVVVALREHRIGLGSDMAQYIQVVRAEPPLDVPPHHLTTNIAMNPSTSPPPVSLRQAAIGSRMRVVGYAPTARDYKRKLLAMGLTPGTEFVVKRHAPLGDPTEIEVRGFNLTLRKDEADSLQVEPIEAGAAS